MEVATLCEEADLPLQGKLCERKWYRQALLESNKLTPVAGNRYRVEDIPSKIRKITDITIDYGLCESSNPHGQGSTILDFSVPKIDVVRIGFPYESIRDKVLKLWGIKLPEDPGRVTHPRGHLKVLPQSESLKRLIANSKR